MILFIFSMFVLVFYYGYASHQYKIFPHIFLFQANKVTKEVISKIKGERQWYYQKTKYTERVPVYDKNAAYNGPTLITSVAKDKMIGW